MLTPEPEAIVNIVERDTSLLSTAYSNMFALPPLAFEFLPPGMAHLDCNTSVFSRLPAHYLVEEDNYVLVLGFESGEDLALGGEYEWLQIECDTTFNDLGIATPVLASTSLESTPDPRYSKKSKDHSRGGDRQPLIVKAPRVFRVVEVAANLEERRGATNWEQKRVSIKKCRASISVKIKFPRLGRFLRVILESGPENEYRCPVFATIRPLSEICEEEAYQQEAQEYDDTEFHVRVAGNAKEVTISRYESRLTIVQLAVILGLQKYKLALTKHVESVILAMFEQLCGFRIGQGTWSRGVKREKRAQMVDKVYRFARIYFPSFTTGTVDVVIRRGAYARTQDHLRRARRRRKGKY